jgi:hypothetical protein
MPEIGRRIMCSSPRTAKRSAESSTAGVLPVFFQQCAVVCVSAVASPAWCTSGTALVLLYSVTSPSVVVASAGCVTLHSAAALVTLRALLTARK